MAIEAGKDDLQIKIILCTLYIVYIVPKIYCESQCLSTPSMTKYPKKLVVFLCYSGVNRQGCFLLEESGPEFQLLPVRRLEGSISCKRLGKHHVSSSTIR